MKKKVKATILMEIIISVFIISLISLGILKSYISISNNYYKTMTIGSMTRLGNMAMEETLAGKEFVNENTKYQLEINKTNFSDSLSRIEIIVLSEEFDEEIKFISYKREEN